MNRRDFIVGATSASLMMGAFAKVVPVPLCPAYDGLELVLDGCA